MSRVMIEMNELIDEISMGPFGSDIKVDNFVDKGVPVLNGSNVTGVRLTEESFNYVTTEKAKSLKKANAKRGDIVITHRGTLGQIAFIPENSLYDNYVISQSQFKVTLKADKVDPAYFTYYFHTNEGQKRLLSFKNHVGVPALAQATTNFRKLEFPLIPLVEQQKIAKVLSDLDAKIALNNKINAELEAMAKTLYEYWFVQFDFPVASTSSATKTSSATGNKNPELVEGYKSSGGKMVWNEELKREIPEGWEVGTISDISELIRGVSYDKKSIKTSNDSNVIPILRATNITGNQIDLNGMVYVPSELVNEKQILNKFDILITMSSGSIDHIGKNGFYYFDETVSFGAFCAKFVPKQHYHFYLFNYTQSDFMSNTIKNECLGTNINNLNSGMVNGFKLVIPDEDILRSFNNKVESIYQKISINCKENQELASLRDWLLPMLMNGQVSLGYVEEQLGMVAEEKESYKK